MKLAGITFCYNAIAYDYCIVEAIKSMLPVCDVVYVLDCGSTDNTRLLLKEQFLKERKVELLTMNEWDSVHGKEKLSFFTNVAIGIAKAEGYDYQLVVQADEILDPFSYEHIKKAVKEGKDGFMCARINLWGSPYRYLTVPTERQPCSTEVVRLTRCGMKAYDDAENIACDNVNFDYVGKIIIWHMGFVRRRSVMKAKVNNMQVNVFQMAHHDPKLDMEEQFNPWLWFDESDTSIINAPLPEVIREWAKERAVDYEIKKPHNGGF